ncbi:hypothetical protein PQX77_008817 [Marasmius sp. AFHP31]|nr:hypothetical protein PQX77_008817 [Marasmius sp. AFHP31]
MSSPKERHYWTQLRSSLTAGQWTSPTPAKAPNGVPLSWAELFRKFNKHCKGYEDVVEVARRVWGLGGLLEGRGEGEGDGEGEMYPVELGGECVLGEGEGGEGRREGREGYEALKRLEGGNFDTLNFALAYYAYALGNPTECLAHLSKVPDVSHVQNHIPLPSTLRAGAGGSALLNVPGGGGTETSSASSFSFTAGSDVSSTMAEIKDGRAWAMVETIRSLCLQGTPPSPSPPPSTKLKKNAVGMANEKLYPTDPQKSLDIYAASFPILTIIESELVSPTNTNPTPSSGGKIDFTSFTQFREVWRWVERLLWRAIVLGARILDIHHSHEHGHGNAEGCRKNDSIWTWLGHYTSCSVYWPSSFRTAHRATISVLYLRALVLRYSPSPSSPSSPSSITPSPPPPWMHTARSVIQEYRAILSVSTTFPKAGERNRKVEDFVDLCVSVWEASGGVGEYTGWVLDVLWWATRLTFNSHRVLRHMTRLAYISGDTNLAKRTFKLYVQVVSKAFQTQTVGDEGEEDGRWVDTLVFGVWMICKTAGVREVREAGRLVGEARKRLRKGKGKGVYGVGDARDGVGEEEEKVREASVELVEGIWNVTMAIKDQNPHTRPTHLQTAHTHFLTALSLHPSSPAAHFQIAISYTRPGAERDLAKAVVHAGRAVEGEPGNVRYWHLLGLVSAKMELWDAAVGALESGVGVGVGGQVGEKRGGEGVEGTPGTRRSSLPVVNGQDYAANANANGGGIDGLPSQSSPPCPPSPPPPPPPPQTNQTPTTPQTQQTIPPCSELLQPTTTTLTSHQTSRHEQFEYALQLRMTQLAVVEYVEGVEGASGRLTEVFQWVAEVRGTTGAGAQSRHSIDGGGPPEIKLKSPSELALTASHHSHSQSGHSENKHTDKVTDKGEGRPPLSTLPTIDSESLQLQPPTPIPITVSPATPDANEKEPPLALDSSSVEKEKPTKKVQQMLKNHVHKGSARVSAISKRIANANSGHGHGGGGGRGGLRRVRSNPDFSGSGGSPSYQASSIHSRKRVTSRSSFLMPSESESVGAEPPPPPAALPSSTQTTKWSSRTTKENRLLSDLWLMSAATFRRLGKIEQAKGAIQEAEVRDEGNSGVWVQLGLYHLAMGQKHHAIDAFQKALFIDPDDVGACVHLARVYLSPPPTSSSLSPTSTHPTPENIDLVAGLLSHLTEGRGWDVPEAWYFLGKAYGMQGRERVGRERECLGRALGLSEGRGVRDLDAAVGWCL